MFRIVFTGAFLLAVTGGAVHAQAPAAWAEVDSLRAAGRFEEALDRLETLAAQAPDEAALLWRRSRTHVDIGEQAASEAVQERHYEAALADAKAAVAADPASADAHLAHAIAAGRKGLISGTKEKIEYSRLVKESADRAIALDPDNGPAYHVRARWNYEVASLGFLERAIVKVVYGGLPKASYEQAVEDFRRSIAIDDSIIINHLELGRTYLQLDEDAKARQALERAMALPAKDPDDPTYQQEARRLLRRL